MIKVREIDPLQKRQLKPFIDFPYRLYKKCPYWIPPLKRPQYQYFNPENNPVFENSDAKLWVAEKEGKVVGRVVGIINHSESELKGEVHGRFGWLEFEDDPEILRALLDIAATWVKEKGAVLLKGPVGFTNMDPAGMTVEGFDELGNMFGPFNYPYYGKYMDQVGYEKLIDWLEFILDKGPSEIPKKIKRIQPILEKKFGVKSFQISGKKEMKEKIKEYFYLVTDSYKDLPSFVPLTDRQAEYYINQYLPFLRPEYIPIVGDGKGNLLGFAVVIPSFSEALVKARGKLFPFGFMHILWTQRFHRTIDLVLIGIVEEWRGKGINGLLFAKAIEATSQHGVQLMRINPILEENQASLSLFKDLGPRLSRRRRLFSKNL